MKKTLFLSAIVCILASCVSMQKFKDLEAKYNETSSKAARLEQANLEQGILINELRAEIARLKEQLAKLQKEYDDMEADYKFAKANLENLQKEYDELNTRFATAIAGNRNENQKLLKELEDARNNLLRREAEVAEKQRELDRLLAEFREKEKRVNELQAILDKKESELRALRDKVMQALLGFTDKGLTVYTKNGKVYVSMDEKLLFASGSWEVGNEGKNAIREVAKVLAQNTDINVMIEGHTDNVPFRGRGDAKDNLDLSVMRATAIARVLLENKGVEPARVVAAGRGDSSPVAKNDTPENRAKNRRSEIILTPNLDDLMNLIAD
ncbi:MAG: OmpA family protein [Bacteroidales bacterium]|jgi:chemotaxis protein MotB|nr:OmpA family protein [Bacteroidales bacterium]